MGWDYDHNDPLVREGKRYGIQKFRCPACNGDGEVEDAAAELKYKAERGDPQARRMIKMLTKGRKYPDA